MKKNKLQTKRKAQKGIRALYARTVGKKVRVSAAASADELDGDVPNVGIGKALTVILILHVLAIAAICIGTMGDDEDPVVSNSVALDEDNKSALETSEPETSDAGRVHVGQPRSYNLDGDIIPRNVSNQRESVSEPNMNVEPRRREPRVIKPRRDPNVGQRMVQNTEPRVINYTIQKGDTFYRLAKKFNVKQQVIMNLNPNVNASKMRIGMVIKVPVE